MDPILVLAREERDRLEKSKADITARLAELDSFLRTYSSLAAMTGQSLTAEAGRVKASVTALNPPSPTIKETVIDKCERLLRDGPPRHTRDLVDALLIMGVPLRASDKVLQVSKILSNDPRFVADRAKGWRLAATKGEGPDGGTSEPSDSRREPLNSAVRTQPQP